MDAVYKPENTALFELIYGKHLISLGGLEAIDNMFSDLDLKGLKLLDIGFGLGGVAFYLARTYQIKIAGVELHNWMLEYAKAHTPENISHLLEFTVYNQAGEILFKPKSFDLVYSKGVLNHVQDKHTLFQQINSLLKADGLFVIADWIHPEYTVNNSNLLVNETKYSYQKVLERTGFTDISFRDDGIIFLGYVRKLLKNMNLCKKQIEKEYGEKLFSIIWDDHQQLIEKIKHNHKFAVRIRARKK